MPDNQPVPAGQHVEPSQFAGSPPSQNPAANPFNVIVSIPKKITIRMVDASALGDYEIWVFLASLTSNAFVGFLVAYLQAVDSSSPSERYALWVTVMFFFIMVIFIVTALRKRSSLSNKAEEIELDVASGSRKQQGKN